MRAPSRRPIQFASMCLLGLSSAATAAPVIWNGGAGNWGDASKWTPAVVPDSGEVLIDGGKPVASVVTLDVPAAVGPLTLDAGDQIIVPGPQALVIDGGSSLNNGTISATSGGLLYLQPGVFNNNGTIQGTDAGTVVVVDLTAGGVLTGSGTLRVTADATLRLAGGTFPRGQITFTSAFLELDQGSTLDNTGQTLQPDAGSTVLLQGGSTILGGTVIGGPGTVQVVDSGALDNVALTGTLIHLAGAQTTLHGTLTNPGPATFAAAPAGEAYDILLSGNVTLAGAGSLTLADRANLIGSAPGSQLINSAGHTLRIAGPAHMDGVGLLNAGRLEIAPASGGLSVVGNVSFVNGTLAETLGGPDFLSVDGNLSLDGTHDLLELTGGVEGGTYVVATFTGTLSGVFEDVSPGYVITYDTPRHQILATVPGVPEPSAAAVLLGASALLLRRRRA